MKNTSIILVILAVLFIGIVALSQTGATKEISLADLRDKIEGGWAGQMIAVSYAAPTEFRYRQRIIPVDELPQWTPDKVKGSLNQDDLYVDMTFAQVIDDKGLDATTEDFGAMFREAKYGLWHANLAARRALKRGVPAALSGTPKYNVHANDIDFQIEADFIGLMAPGQLRSSNEIGMRAGRVMNYGDGIYGGLFVSCMYSAAFFENDPRKLVEIGLSCLPSKSPYAMVIADTLKWSKAHPSDWEKVWQLINEKWDGREPCPSGALRPYNIDAKLNGAYIALGLLYGDRDFGKTIIISTRAGQDSDCNPASAAGVLGVALGYKAIPDEWKGGIPAIADEKFRYTNHSFRSICKSSERHAIALVQKNGGKLSGETLAVKMQAPRPPKLEIWDDYGSPVERIPVTDPRWKLSGDWKGEKVTRIAAQKGSEAAISFEGTGVIIVGPYLATGGKADIYLDGKLHSTVDVYPDENTSKGSESVWHAFGLKNGKHDLRLVVRGETYGESRGTDIGIDDLVIFR